MKKFFSLFVVMAMVLSFCACNNNQEGQQNTTQESNTTQNEKTETWDKPSGDMSGKTAFATTKNEFTQNINKLVDASEYEVKTHDDSVIYNLKYENNIDYNFDYTVKFYDGLNITLPTTHDSMKKNGWKTDESDDKKISNKVQTGIKYTNDNNESIILWTQNFDDSDEDKYAPLKDCKLYGLDITMFSEKSKKDESGEYIKYYDKNNTPDFSICDGITSVSSIAEVIEILGKPSNITYYEKSGKVNLSYLVKVDKAYSSIHLYFVEDGGYMSQMKYEYSYAD